MKLKYYLRGLGIGIIVTTIILMICFSRQKSSVSDEEIMKRAAELGMMMPKEDGVMVESSEMESTERQTGKSNQDDLKKTEKDAAKTDEPTQDVMAQSDAAPQDAAEPSSEPAQDDTAQTSESAQDSTAQTSEPAQDAAVQSGESPQDHQQGTSDGQQSTAEVYRLLIQHGDVCRTVCDTLAANGVIADSESFRKYLMELGYASFLSVGEYDIPYGISMEEVAEILKAGPTRKID